MEMKNNMGQKQKYIFVTGGVLSGVGKGITAASIGVVLQAKGATVSIQKCDPYLNVDAGLLNPAEHGECFVTKDGAETDLDLGHYERFLDIETTKRSITLSGRLLRQLINDERAGKFQGQTVQLVPHLTQAIQETIIEASVGSDVHIVEIGGTVGDYEALSFIEAIREFSQRVGRENCLFLHVVYVPFLETSKEFKTKPAQNALNDLRGYGINPDSVIVRTDTEAPKSVAQKISLFSGVAEQNILLVPDVDTVYRVPLVIAESALHDLLTTFSGFEKRPVLSTWKKVIQRQDVPKERVIRVGLVVKYMDNQDTYLSVTEALKAAAWAEGLGVDIVWINAETAGEADFSGVDALLVPGGFGSRGVEGMIDAARYALDTNKPYLGICLGLQVAVIAAARKAGIMDAHSSEFTDTKNPVVYIMKGQEGKESTGGTLRLGDYTATLVPHSKVAAVYGSTSSTERHRHRYEVNQEYIESIERGGLVISGTSQEGRFAEYIESPSNTYFVTTQAHPEFKSRPTRPHPLFLGLVRQAMIDKNIE